VSPFVDLSYIPLLRRMVNELLEELKEFPEDDVVIQELSSMALAIDFHVARLEKIAKEQQ